MRLHRRENLTSGNVSKSSGPVTGEAMEIEQGKKPFARNRI
jgi:hypothetical protein